MAITKVQKSDIVKKYGKTEQDTGTPEVQIALLTARINDLAPHFEKFTRTTIHVWVFSKWSGDVDVSWTISKRRISNATGKSLLISRSENNTSGEEPKKTV